MTAPPVTAAGYNRVDMSEPRTHDQPWQDFDLVQRAAAYAAAAHRTDVRKGTTIPYLSHLWAVAALVAAVLAVQAARAAAVATPSS